MLSLALASCQTPSGSLPPVEQPKPKAVDPRICMAVRRGEPLPAGAAIPQPVTAEERQGVALFLTWVAEQVGVRDENTDRSELARRQSCSR